MLLLSLSSSPSLPLRRYPPPHCTRLIRGASAVAECQGMFKMQHDLDKVRALHAPLQPSEHHGISMKCLDDNESPRRPLSQLRIHDQSDATRVTLKTGSQVHPRVPSHLPSPASHRQRGGRWRLVSCRQDKHVFCTAASASIIVIVLRCRG